MTSLVEDEPTSTASVTPKVDSPLSAELGEEDWRRAKAALAVASTRRAPGRRSPGTIRTRPSRARSLRSASPLSRTTRSAGPSSRPAGQSSPRRSKARLAARSGGDWAIKDVKPSKPRKASLGSNRNVLDRTVANGQHFSHMVDDVLPRAISARRCGQPDRRCATPTTFWACQNRERGRHQEGIPQARQEPTTPTATRRSEGQGQVREFNTAYEVLGDEEKRAPVRPWRDRCRGQAALPGLRGLRRRRRRPAAGGFAGFEFGAGGRPVRGPAQRPRPDPADDIFSQLFGDAFRRERRGEPAGQRRPKGEDVDGDTDREPGGYRGEAKKRLSLPAGRDVDVVIPKGVARRPDDPPARPRSRRARR